MGSNSAVTRYRQRAGKGFTLIEILVVIGIIAILAAIVIIAINPARQFAQARNSQRTANVNAILNAVGQYIADNKGLLPHPIDALADDTAAPIGSAGANICALLVPTYMPALVVDPATDPDGAGALGVGEAIKSANCASGADSGYTVEHDATNRVTVCAPKAAAAHEPALPGATAICVTR
jgi:type IV pilus assembly protein PilA